MYASWEGQQARDFHADPREFKDDREAKCKKPSPSAHAAQVEREKQCQGANITLVKTRNLFPDVTTISESEPEANYEVAPSLSPESSEQQGSAALSSETCSPSRSRGSEGDTNPLAEPQSQPKRAEATPVSPSRERKLSRARGRNISRSRGRKKDKPTERNRSRGRDGESEWNRSARSAQHPEHHKRRGRRVKSGEREQQPQTANSHKHIQHDYTVLIQQARLLHVCEYMHAYKDHLAMLCRVITS